MKVRVRKEPSSDGWHRWVIESKKYWFMPWLYRGMIMVTPMDNQTQLKTAESRAIAFAEEIKNPTIIEIRK